MVTAVNAGGKTLGSVTLAPPDKLPQTAYHVEGVPEGKIDFTPKPGANSVVREGRDLEKLADPKGAQLLALVRRSASVEIETADGRWVGEIHLPKGSGLEGKVIRCRSQAGYNSTIHYSGRSVVLSRDQAIVFKYLRGQWIREGEFDNNGLVYADETWSGVLPAEWIAPGLRLEFRQGDLNGELSD